MWFGKIKIISQKINRKYSFPLIKGRAKQTETHKVSMYIRSASVQISLSTNTPVVVVAKCKPSHDCEEQVIIFASKRHHDM